MRFCGEVVNSSWLAAAGLTVSCCAAGAKLPAVAVSVGSPSVSLVYWKLALLAPAAIVKGRGRRLNAALPDVVLRLIVSGPLEFTGLPKASSRATVIVPEATPAVRVCGAVVNASWLAAAGSIVSCCVADAKPPAAAEIVGIPAAVSVYWKLTALVPAASVSGEAGLNVPVPEDVLKLTVSAALASTEFPKASSRASVIVPDVAPAAIVCGAVVNARWLAAAGLTVSCCVAEASPPAAAVSVGVPAAVSSYWKLTEPTARRIVSGDAGLHAPLPEVVFRLTARPPVAVTGLPKASSSAIVIVPEAMPAVKVCGAVVNASWLAVAGLTVSC